MLALVLLAVVALGVQARSRSSTTVVHTIVIGHLPDALVLDARSDRAFVADDADATVSVLDLVTDRVLHTVAAGQSGTLAPITLALDARTHHLFVADRGDNGASSVVRLLDTGSSAPLATVRVGSEADALAVDERAGHVLVATGGDEAGRVSLLDSRSGAVVHTTRVGLAPVAVAVDPRTARAFVLGTALLPTQEGVGGPAGLVGVLDTRSGALVRTVVVGHASEAIVVDPQTARVFAANSGDNTVSVLDAQTGALLRTVAVGWAPAALAVDTRDGRVFVVDDGDGTLSVLDARTGTLWRTLRVFPAATASAVMWPYALAVDGVRARVYVTAWGRLDQTGLPTGGGQLAILDARSGTLLRMMALGVAPRSVAVQEGTGRVVVVDSGGVVRAPQSLAERWVRPMAARMPWLRRILPRAPEAVRIPGSADVIDMDAGA